ncbi:hypothetical protein CXY01_18350 [Cellulomonas xylanilytica]|uniref:Uncharacterized protein n=1 Tax=Cellulomonas xylanilytica TaxID=233583 RepID=A0A510V842_9CELL|nr:hypothetical protein CXY01_18350 [Cellulomonas xylanilytica]
MPAPTAASTAITHHRLRSADKYSFMPNARSSALALAPTDPDPRGKVVVPHRPPIVSRGPSTDRGGCG